MERAIEESAFCSCSNKKLGEVPGGGYKPKEQRGATFAALAFAIRLGSRIRIGNQFSFRQVRGCHHYMAGATQARASLGTRISLEIRIGMTGTVEQSDASCQKQGVHGKESRRSRLLKITE